MNKRGIGKTLEAVIAVLIILMFIYFFSPKQEVLPPITPKNVEEAQAFILQQISTKDSLRNCAIQATTSGTCNAAGCANIDSFVKANTPSGLTYVCEICPTANTCSTNTPIDVSVYTDSVFLSGTTPKIVRIYFWQNT